LEKLNVGGPGQAGASIMAAAEGTNGKNSHQETPLDILARVDQLSEKEINDLLNQLLPEEDKP
jgi:hypothetical protein